MEVQTEDAGMVDRDSETEKVTTDLICPNWPLVKGGQIKSWPKKRLRIVSRMLLAYCGQIKACQYIGPRPLAKLNDFTVFYTLSSTIFGLYGYFVIICFV